MTSLLRKVRFAAAAQGRAWVVAARVGVLPLTTLVSRRERWRLWRIREVLWGGERTGVYPDVPLGEITRREDVVTLLELPSEPYHISEIKLLAITALLVRGDARVVFEIGTADGRTTRNLAANLPPDGRVHTLTLPLSEDPVHRSMQSVRVGHGFLGTPEGARITQLWGDSTRFDYSPYAGSCQLVFIDAGNSEEAVRLNSEAALRLVDRRRGVIVWNDALHFGTQRALPRLGRERALPVHQVRGTGLAILCFARGHAVDPREWAQTGAPEGLPV
jgi:predicted O-methyltransferase YrrM